MTPASDLRARAETLARQLPPIRQGTPAAQTAQPGSAGRRRPGQGETFWQYRRYGSEDPAGSIDWRRSARGDDLYVRESELETSRSALFWADGSPGFRWKAATDSFTKAQDAITLMLAAAILMAAEGERVGALGSEQKAGLGTRAIDRLASELLGQQGQPFAPAGRASLVVIASDFYEPAETWRARLQPVAARCRHGVLLAVSAPDEAAFPFRGRLQLTCPATDRRRLLGRAETVREQYLRRFEAQVRSISALAGELGWGHVRHVTGEPMLPAAARLVQETERQGLRS